MINKKIVRDSAVLNRDKRAHFKKPFCTNFRYYRRHAFAFNKKLNKDQCIDCGIIDSRGK